jgi:hypothetical protein
VQRDGGRREDTARGSGGHDRPHARRFGALDGTETGHRGRKTGGCGASSRRDASASCSCRKSTRGPRGTNHAEHFQSRKTVGRWERGRCSQLERLANGRGQVRTEHFGARDGQGRTVRNVVRGSGGQARRWRRASARGSHRRPAVEVARLAQRDHGVPPALRRWGGTRGDRWIARGCGSHQAAVVGLRSGGR